MIQDQKVICANGETHKPDDCEELIKKYILQDESMVPLYRALFISQYFAIMKTVNDIQEKEKEDDLAQSDPSCDLTCIESTDELDYTHWCDSCNLSTYYCQKPPKDYPHPLCLTDDCLAAYIVDVVVKEHDKSFNYDPYECAEEEEPEEEDEEKK